MTSRPQDTDSADHTMEFRLEEVLREANQQPKCVLGTLIGLSGATVGRSFSLRDASTTIGRGEVADIRVETEGVSRLHARIEGSDGSYRVVDLDSTNGTFCNGQRVFEPTELRNGDRIQLGPRLVWRFELSDELDEQMRARLYDLATRDPLTNAYNRHYLNEKLPGEWAWSVRHGRPMAAIAFDVDHFKRVNDTYGHPAGDAVLRELVARASAVIRTEDVLARVGGEEFLVLCRATDPAGGRALAERLRNVIAQSPFASDAHVIPVTVSLGVATTGTEGVDSPLALLAKADALLYAAKANGRNRVETG